MQAEPWPAMERQPIYADCEAEFAAAAPCCPACGSGDRNVPLTDAGLGFEGSLRIKARHGEPGRARTARKGASRGRV